MFLGWYYCTGISDGRRCTTLNESSAMSNGLCTQSDDRSDDAGEDLFIWTQRCSSPARRHCIAFKRHLELCYYTTILMKIITFRKASQNFGLNIFHGTFHKAHYYIHHPWSIPGTTAQYLTFMTLAAGPSRATVEARKPWSLAVKDYSKEYFWSDGMAPKRGPEKLSPSSLNVPA